MTDPAISILTGIGLAAAGCGLACVGRLVKAWLLARGLRGVGGPF